MTCPKCQHVNPDGAKECAQCGVIFSKWKDDWSRPAPAWPAEPPQAPVAPPRNTSSRVKAIGLVGAAAGWFWFLFWAPGGLPVAANAYHDADNGFALVVPEGWKTGKTRDCKSFSAGINPASACVVLTISRDVDNGEPGPSIQVMVAPTSLFTSGWHGSVRITEALKPTLAEAIQKGIAGTLPGYSSDASEIISVDNINAMRAHGSAIVQRPPVMTTNKAGTLPYFTSMPEVHVSMISVLVPGGSRMYLLAGASQSEDERSLAGPFDAIVQSFRITHDRATPFQLFGGLAGSIPGDAILGALVGVTLMLLKL